MFHVFAFDVVNGKYIQVIYYSLTVHAENIIKNGGSQWFFKIG